MGDAWVTHGRHTGDTRATHGRRTAPTVAARAIRARAAWASGGEWGAGERPVQAVQDGLRRPPRPPVGVVGTVTAAPPAPAALAGASRLAPGVDPCSRAGAATTPAEDAADLRRLLRFVSVRRSALAAAGRDTTAADALRDKLRAVLPRARAGLG